jgi:protoheme IX farnesyltransferase
VADLLELGKPRITGLVVCTTAVGLWLAPGSLGASVTALFLAATALLVASANTLNCWIERHTDALMHRTRDRPLPAGRLGPGLALGVGLAEGAIALALIAWTTNPLTLGLGALALSSYVLAYTPLKRVGWWAVLVGAVPGAIPPLMGSTASSGSLSAAGWILFGILFFWQLPHFIAISLNHASDYRRGGLRVLPLVHGERAARRHLFGYTLLLVAVSLAAPAVGLAGPLYAATAALLGAGFLLLAAYGLRPVVEAVWARRTFAYSLVYLSLLIVVLVLDAR